MEGDDLDIGVIVLASTGVSDGDASSVGDEEDTDSFGKVLDCKVDNCVGAADDTGTGACEAGACEANDGAAEIRTLTVGDCVTGDSKVGVPENKGELVVGAMVTIGINEGSFDNGTGDWDIGASEVGKGDIRDGNGTMEGAVVIGELVTEVMDGTVLDRGERTIGASDGKSDITGYDDVGDDVIGAFKLGTLGAWVGNIVGASETSVGNSDDGVTVDGAAEDIGAFEVGTLEVGVRVDGVIDGVTKVVGSGKTGELVVSRETVGALVDGATDGVAKFVGTSETGELVVGPNTVGVSESGAWEVGIFDVGDVKGDTEGVSVTG
jgi:hypothetical protein